MDASILARIDFGLGSGDAGAAGATFAAEVVCSATTVDRPAGSLDGSADGSVASGDSAVGGIALRLGADGVGALRAAEPETVVPTV